MKVQVTITGTFDLDKGDVKALRKLPAEHVLDTMRDVSRDMRVKMEDPAKLAKLARKLKAKLTAKAPDEAAPPAEKMPSETTESVKEE